MLTAVQTEWIRRLRDDGLEQTEGKLRNSGGYCCLGVGCEVLHDFEAMPDGVKWVVDEYLGGNLVADANPGSSGRQRTTVYGYTGVDVDNHDPENLSVKREYSSDEADDMPFDVVCDALGISGAQSYALANMNDAGISFPDIADALEGWLS